MRILTYSFFSCLLLLGLTSCLEDDCQETTLVQGFAPVTINADDWRNSSFLCTAPINVCEATSFYVYEQYLFMVENGQGLHIIDNTDADNPEPITFMEVPGGQGLAVRNDLLYINQYTDLVTFDLSDPTEPRFVHRTKDVFSPNSIFDDRLADGRFVSNWVPTGEVRTVDCTGNGRNEFWEGNVLFTNDVNRFQSSNFASDVSITTGGAGAESVGQGGSLARFTITQSNLYAVDDNSLRAFSLLDPEAPEFVKTIPLDWGVETIFPTADKLFIGTSRGMHIYGLTDPLNPEHLSTFEHVLGCDPVVVSGNLAYITLWGGRDCGSTGDQLEIVDVSDARNPVSLQLTPMSNSHGLGVAEGKLFLCNQWEGFTVYDLDDAGLLGEVLDTKNDINARDVILLPGQNRAIVLGYNQEGIQQYDYSDGGELTATSRIAVCQ